MFKVLLCDDEPLVLIGLQSMISWSDYGLELCGTARNGEKAIECIDTERPDIVIADIKMPVKSGLEVAEYCKNTYGDAIQFIILTGFEELEYLKRAIKLSVVDYLMKVELTAQTLVASLKKASEKLLALRSTEQKENTDITGSSAVTSMQHIMRDKFFSRLLNHLFESEMQYEIQRDELHINSNFKTFAAVCVEIVNGTAESDSRPLALYTSTTALVNETVQKYCTTHLVPLDTKNFVIIFCLEDDKEDSEIIAFISNVMDKTQSLVKKFFSVTLSVAIGKSVKSLYEIADSFDLARQKTQEKVLLNLAAYRKNISQAFDEMDANALKSAMDQIADCIELNPTIQVQALDAASRILYMTMSLLQDGEGVVSRIFADEKDNYRCLYQLHSCAEISWYLTKLNDGLCEELNSRKKDYKLKLIEEVQAYIRTNIKKKINLNTTADLFNISANYLSQLFTRYASCSFTEYVNEQKIEKAKKLLQENKNKVGDVAEALGFENAFYFSKVFKKYTGMSPHDFACR